jgi:hypothetical protein
VKTEGYKTLPSRTFYKEGESLFSYLLRTAFNNGISILLLLNMMRKNEKYLLHKGDIRRIDYYPESVFDLKKLIQLTGINQADVYKSTFANVLNAFGYSTNGEKARLMNNMIRDTLHFCTQCLKEGYGYNLMWKIEGIRCCQKHSQRLLDKCSFCDQEICYEHIVAMDLCPHCNQLLTNIHNSCADKEVDNIAYQQSLQTNLIQLIHEKGHFEVQSLAQKLLFLMNGFQPIYDADTVKKSAHQYSLTHLLQYARNTIVAHKNIKLSFILEVLHGKDIDINSLNNMEIPTTFLESLLEGKSIQWTREFTCIAPWCKENGQRRSLIPTNSKHAKKSGRKLSHYLVCRECFCEYAFDEDRNLVERTSFITAYNILGKYDISSMTWPERKKCLSMNRERIKRVSAYFNARQLLRGDIDPTQYKINSSLGERFILALKQGQELATIRYWSSWDGYDHYLLHRYHPTVMREIFNQRYDKEATGGE